LRGKKKVEIIDRICAGVRGVRVWNEQEYTNSTFSGEVREYTQQLRTRVAGRGSGGVLYRTHPGQSRWAVANIGAEF